MQAAKNLGVSGPDRHENAIPDDRNP